MAIRDSGGPLPPRRQVLRPHVTQAPYPSPHRMTPRIDGVVPLEKPHTSILRLPDEDTAEYPQVWVSPSTQDTAPLRTDEEVARLKQQWLERPTWDIEWSTGYNLMQADLAVWHQEQVARRARKIGCSVRMAHVLEELARCWLDAVPVRSTLARRILRLF